MVRVGAMPRCLLAACAVPSMLAAQSADGPRVKVSGVVFGNFQVRTDAAAKDSAGGKSWSRFDIARAYLNFRAPVGQRTRVRVTTDVFQNAGSADQGGWTLRLKYAYLQHELIENLAGIEGFTAVARVGMLHTVAISHVQRFWPRWLGSSALRQHGYFASSDVGAALRLTFPQEHGEAYFTITNGPGYAEPENDRFKDIAARVSLTPFASSSGFFRSLAISPWYSKGWSASEFVLGGPGQVDRVGDGLQKDRRGLFIGLQERRLTGGLEFAQRLEQVEGGANTAPSPRTVGRRTGNLISAFAILRPADIVDTSRRSKLSVIGRFDRFQLDDGSVATTDLGVLGVIWSVKRTSLALDFQRVSSPIGDTTPSTATWFLHWVAYY